MSEQKLTVQILMYRLGELGDCFLLQFKNASGNSNVLIDCGSFRNGKKSQARLQVIVTQIQKQLNGQPLHVVVGTHQHNDHISGFVHCDTIFKSLNVQQVWLSWLDDPQDLNAQKVQASQANLVAKLKGLADTAAKVEAASIGEENIGTSLIQQLKDVLGFYLDEEGQRDAPRIPQTGINNLKKLGVNPVKYLSPGMTLPLPGLETNVKIYVLGPPKNSPLLFDIHPSKTETYDPKLQSLSTDVFLLQAALTNYSDVIKDDDEGVLKERHFPFTDYYKIDRKDFPGLSKGAKELSAAYEAKDLYWRNIDHDWEDAANQLALYLDSYTNNTSLALAFETIPGNKVLLFPGDAQTGNWLSWKNVKWEGKEPGFSTLDLLKNTVVYKVGHHASHNATFVESLEAMTRPDLVALIPVDKSDANIKKVNGWKMPAKNLLQRLKEKSNYRVLRMDDGYADGCLPGDPSAGWELNDGVGKVEIDEFCVKYTIET